MMKNNAHNFILFGFLGGVAAGVAAFLGFVSLWWAWAILGVCLATIFISSRRAQGPDSAWAFLGLLIMLTMSVIAVFAMSVPVWIANPSEWSVLGKVGYLGGIAAAGALYWLKQ